MTPRGWAGLALAVLAALLVRWWRRGSRGSGRPRPAPTSWRRWRDLPADAGRPGPGLPRGAAPRHLRRLVAVGLVVALLLGLTPLGARARRAGRAARSAATGSPRRCSAGWPWCFVGRPADAAVRRLAAVVLRPVRAVHPGLGRLDRRPAQVVRGQRGDRRGRAARLLHRDPASRRAGGGRSARSGRPRWWCCSRSSFPVLVEPIFNRFTPMEPGPLRTELMALAAPRRRPVRDVLVADASRRTRAVNAYVSGLGPTRRIVVYDTLLREAPPAEVASRRRARAGPRQGPATCSTGTAHRGARRRRRGRARSTCSAPGVPLLRAGRRRLGRRAARVRRCCVAVVTVAGLLAAPAQAVGVPAGRGPGRRARAGADRRPGRLRGDAAAGSSRVNLADPDPPRWEYLYSASHPSTVERMAAARAYARGAGG